MLHLVFEPSGAEALEKSFTLDDSLQGEILVVKDDFAVGPIQNIYEAEGFQARKAWWAEVLRYSPYEEQLAIVDDKMTVHNLKKTLSENGEETLWIWMGQNQHDVCGYYWLITQLAEWEGRIFVLYLNNLPFINAEGGIFYPKHLWEIAPKEFIKARKLARPVTLSEFELDPDEWKKLCDENAVVRLLEGGKKIVSKEASFYDADLLAALGTKTLKLQRILSNAFGKMPIQTGDAFLVWRLRTMAGNGQLLLQGNWEKGWKELTFKDTKGELFAEIGEAEEE